MSALRTGHCRPGIILYLVAILVILVARSTHSAPIESDSTQVAEYDGAGGCYYNFQHYQEGARIITNEPCLNCTCHNRMLMCYLRVCPFTKAIGQDCTVEKRPDQCCPVITCPEVPVQLLTSTTSSPSKASPDTGIATTSTELGFPDTYGCNVNDRFFADGAQLPIDSNSPCELCYCIRNKTTCIMQQCTLSVAGCKPVYQPGICCPVKYNCEYDGEHEATAIGTTPGLIMTTTMAPHTEAPKCDYENKTYDEGELIYTIQPCQFCYCFTGRIACMVQSCGKPMESYKKNCTALPPADGECCPNAYLCEDDEGNSKIELTENDKKNEDSSEPGESFPGADNSIPEKVVPGDEITEVPQTVSPLGNDVPESEPTKSSNIEQTSDLTTSRPESMKPVESNESENKKDDSEPTSVDEKISTESSEEALKTTENPASMEDDSKEETPTSTAPSEVTSSSRLPQDNLESTTTAPIEKEETSTEEELKNDISTENKGEESTKKDEKENSNESSSTPSEKDLPVEESTTTISKEQENSSESSSPVSNTDPETHSETVNTIDITTEIPSENIKNKQTKESDEIPTDEESSDRLTSTPNILENDISNSSEKPSSEDISASKNVEPSSVLPKEGEETEEDDISTTPGNLILVSDVKDQSTSDVMTERPNDFEKSDVTDSSLTTESPSQSTESGEKTSSETSTIQNAVFDSSSTVPVETETLKNIETDEIYTTIQSISQTPSNEITSTSLTESSSQKSITDENSTEQSNEPDVGSKDEEPEIPMQGPTGIPIPDRVPEHKAEDKDAVTDNIVTEVYLSTSSGIPDNLQTEKSESELTTYSPSVDSEIDIQSSTPLYEELTKDNQDKFEESSTAKDDENPDEVGVSIKEIPKHDEPSDNETSEMETPEKIESSTESVDDDQKIKKTDSSKPNDETENQETSTNLPVEKETMQPDAGISSTESDSTIDSSTDDNLPEQAVTEKSIENEIDESSKDVAKEDFEGVKTTEASVFNHPMGESVTATDSNKGNESSEFVTPTTEPEEIEGNTEISGYTEVPTESQLGSTTTISNRLSDEDDENKIPAEPSSSEALGKETKLNDQEPNDQMSTTESVTLPTDNEKTENKESPLPEVVSTTIAAASADIDSSTNQMQPTNIGNESEIKKEEEPSQSTEANSESSHMPEIEIEMPVTPESRPEHGIPGEGNCLVDGQSYSNNSAIPPANACQISCQCISSIVQCEFMQCSAPPADLSNCVPVSPGPGACCPMYTCDLPPSVELQTGNQMTDNHTMYQGESQTTQQMPSEENVTFEKVTIAPEVIESSTTLQPESSPEPDSNEKTPSPVSPAEEDTSSSPTDAPVETSTELEIVNKSDANESSTSNPENNDDDQRPIGKVPEESEDDKDKDFDGEQFSSSETPKLETETESSTEVNFEPSEKITPSHDEEPPTHPAETTESVVQETTPIPYESTGSENPKATDEPTEILFSSTEKSQSVTSLVQENSTEEKPKEDEKQESDTENPTKLESITTIPITSDFSTSLPENIESDQVSTTKIIIDDESHKSQDFTTEITESHSTAGPQSSTEGNQLSSEYTESLVPVVETSTDSVSIDESTSPKIAETSEEDFNEPNAASPTTIMPVTEENASNEQVSSEPVTEEIQPSTEKPSEPLNIDDIMKDPSSTEKTSEDMPVETEPVTEKEMVIDISTEKLDEAPKEVSHDETPKESQTESQGTTQSTTVMVDEMEKVTEKSNEIQKTTEKINNSESTQSTEDEISSEPEVSLTPTEKTEINTTEEPKLAESTTSQEQPTSIDEEADKPKENSDEKSESTTQVKIVEDLSSESSTTPESIKKHDQTSEMNNEPSSEAPIEEIKYPSTQEPSSSEISVDEPVTPVNAHEKPGSEIDSTTAHDIPEQGNKIPDDAAIPEIPEVHGEDEPISTHPHEEDEHRPMETYTTTSHPETVKPHTRPEYPDQIVPETDDDTIFPPDNADIKNPYQPDEGDSEDYDDQAVYGPGTCRYGGKIYMSAQQIPREDACDFCFCFRSDIICLQQSCPPPIPGCHEEPIGGFCCPRYECPVSMATSFNVTTTTTTTTTTIPPHFLSHAYRAGTVRQGGCLIGNRSYRVGEEIKSKSGPCMRCLCGGDGKMKCDPQACTAGPMLKEMIAHAAAKKRRR